MTLTPDPIRTARLKQDFLHRLGTAPFPCVGAKAALGRDQIEIMVARDLASGWDDLRIHHELRDFAVRYTRRPTLFTSFVVLFEGPRVLDEPAFEKHMWARLQSLADKDAWLGQPQDPRVDPDPASPHFSLSFGGEGFFVVGLHPRASRRARRFAVPALVFNLHDQFERLRRDGRYAPMRRTILDRDARYSGSINPMLAEHGSISEARQYSGRAVGADWTCPFHPAPRNMADVA